MTLRHVAGLMALLLSVACSRAEIIRDTDNRFPVDPAKPASVDLSLFAGSVLVKVSDTPEVRVQIHSIYEAQTEAKADEIRGHLALAMVQTGNAVKIGAEYSRDMHWTFEAWPPVKLAVTLTVPQHSDLHLLTRDGGVSVMELTGNVQVKTGYGLIYFKGVEGDVAATSDYGDIVVAHCTGNLKLRSISGSFRVGPVGGRADVYGYGGEIEVQSAGGGVRAETSGADLVCGFHYPIVAPATLLTGGASIQISLSPRSACTLDLKASIFGKIVNVKNQLPLVARSGGVGHSRAVLELNGGGPRIQAKASGGNIFLVDDPTLAGPAPAAKPLTP